MDNYVERYDVRPNFNHKERQRRLRLREMKELPIGRSISDNFFQTIFKRDLVIWTMVHADIRKPEFDKVLKQAEKAFSKFSKQSQVPICSSLLELSPWIQRYDCKVIVDERSIGELNGILECSNVINAHIVIEKDVEILKIVRRDPNYRKIASIQDNYHRLLEDVKEQMERYNISAIKGIKNEELNEEALILIERIRFPNFMKLSSKGKGKLISYRVNLYCLVNLDLNMSEMEISRYRFVEQCKKDFTTPKDVELLNKYATYPFNEKEILKFYTEESFFYKCLNNTLRTAKETQEFFLIGHAFNLMFKSIQSLSKKQFPYSNKQNRNFMVYRGADLSQSECQHLQSCIGSYIQIQGFVSTSRDRLVAEKFTKMRKNNKILEIRFANIEDINSPYLSEDYGFVDLAQISEFNEGEVLFNSLNIFKILGKESRGEFQYFMLSHGQIFNVLASKEADKLSAEDQYAYYSYKQLMQQKESLNDLGEAYSRCNENSKAVLYYESKLKNSKMNQKQIEELAFKKSKALIDNGEPEKSLQELEKHFASADGLINIRVTNRVTVPQIKEEIEKLVDYAEQTSDAALKIDKFQIAENRLENYIQKFKVEQSASHEWNINLALGQIDMSMKLIEVNNIQMLYRKQYELIQSTEILTNQVLKKINHQKESLKHKIDLHLILTHIYQMTAQIQPNLTQENIKIDILELQKKFCRSEEALKHAISQNEYIHSIVAIRRMDIERRKNSVKGKLEQSNKNMVVLQNHLNELKDIKGVEAEIPKGYQVLAEMAKDTNQITSPLNAMHFFEKQQFANENFYGEHDPRTIKSNIEIAQCLRENNESQQSLSLLKNQYTIVPYKTKKNHTVVAKTLYLMGMSYLDLGEYTFALACFQKAIKVLEATLSKKDLSRSIDKYRIILQLGRSYTHLGKIELAQLSLNEYKEFMQFMYKKDHSEIAKALNYLGLLYLKMKSWDLALKYLKDSAHMYKFTQGATSILSARIQCNISTVYAIFKKKQTALQLVDQAQSILNAFYQASDINASRINPDTHLIYYHYAEVYRLCSDFKEAKIFYLKSMETQKQLKGMKQSMMQAMNKSVISSKKNVMKDRHEENCKQKYIECLYNINKEDKKLQRLLYEFIAELQKQIHIFVKKEKQFLQLKESEANTMSQQKRMLEECHKMHAQVVTVLKQG